MSAGKIFSFFSFDMAHNIFEMLDETNFETLT